MELLAKLEADRGNIHLVIENPSITRGQSMNVRVITRGRAHIGANTTRAWVPRQSKEEATIKKATSLLKFHAC